MIKRAMLFILAIAALATPAYADKTENVEINVDKKEVVTVPYTFGQIKVSYQGNPRTGEPGSYLNADIENTNPDNYAIIIFKNKLSENDLKHESPSIKFRKHYNGNKYIEDVCTDARMRTNIVLPEDKPNTIPFIVSYDKLYKLEIPYYIATIEYNKNGTIKNLIIQDEEKITLNVFAHKWDTSDFTYVAIKDSVESFINQFNEHTFCENSRHPISLEEQQQPWVESCDSLRNVVLEQRSQWEKEHEAYQCYDALVTQLDGINWNDHKKSSCTEDKPLSKAGHKCEYCSKDTQGLYQVLDNTYQKLNTGKISADEAKKTAKAVNECLLKKKRAKDTQYETKIANYYQGIMNY